MKILLVEDDVITATLLREVLTAEYYTVELATDGQNGLTLATLSNFDLILLDLLIPKLDGINLCRQLRAQGIQKPILLLTAKDQSADVVKGLDAGADDYVTKPYDISELLARIRALLRRGKTELIPNLLSWENLDVNVISAEVTYKGQPISLSPKEYSLLGLFLRNPQRIFSRSEIIDRLWSIDATPSEGAVTNLIKDLRQKLKMVGMSAELLETVYGLGYRLKMPPQTQDGEQSRKTDGLRKTKNQTAIAAINKTIERYKDTFAQRVTLLERAEQALHTGQLLPELRQEASNEAHKLAGTLGSFGYETGSKLARAIEHLLMRDENLALEDAVQLSELIGQLKEALSQSPISFTIEQLEPVPLPLVLVINDESFANQLKIEAAVWGVRIEVALNWESYQQSFSQFPKVILLKINGQKSSQKSLKLLEQLKQQFPNTPILVIAEQDNLMQRVAVARLGVQRFLTKPTNTEVFQVITQMLAQFQGSQGKVMVIDDDPVMLDILSNLLKPWGLAVKTLQNPQKFWETLITTTPDLLMIDLEMPTYSGIDLCRVVRQDSHWGNVPILVVTVHTDIKSIQQVFAAGADDFIGKPVVGPELITRVINRINRSRLQQKLKT
ncbi:multi-component transcriptional regulator, winged helix family [Trichormus variabilis ATCC 29413]|uniref:Multi-component transcriptional regulator, winged helix family n=2 Tax=Anabaena variabilis TaxID=264691 RepID=Q3MCN4_TRIV2|nr:MULTISPECIES: response regulator [Nostocaceae]ABA21252.1 multi-component transcriptional regulator, winged helix family [Trichormus variabilis ATCC 29413]MBC1214581.1 response regulator [Trichormus variabilis ARAD]MBC1256745.1 response regulator [Trichormus variabilis V5]MBC1266318.1 response regulator [Trichormus variabilis FSR]MBC1301066.1 response regulator [Trichormus variabilis N2B]